MSLQSALGRALAHGSAGAGTGHWWQQRLSAMALVPLGLWFLANLLALPDLGHATVTAWAAQPLHAALLGLLVVAALWHSLLGLAVIVEDYVHGHGRKTATLIALQLAWGLAAAIALAALVALQVGGGR